MPITINGTGTVTGLSVGGLPDGTVDKDTLAAGATAGHGAFRAFRNSAQTITHDTYEVVECANESFDLQNWYDTSTFKYTPQVAGYYQFDAHIWIAGLSTNNVELQVALYKNTTRVTRSCKTDTTTYNGQQGQGIHDIIQLNGSSDYVQLRLLQYNSSSSNRDLSFGTELTYFSGFLLEAT